MRTAQAKAMRAVNVARCYMYIFIYIYIYIYSTTYAHARTSCGIALRVHLVHCVCVEQQP